ncbi:MAG: tyrosine--tRNA ligase [Gemmatimonadales bacterium]|nr:tyrosine--tRNA ligase [Gemmatimonadales bacterium]
MPDLKAELTQRGLLHDATPGLEERLGTGPITGYVGFDPTAESLHVGNLIPMMGLAWLHRAGGTAIAVLGGGTGLVGDPSGKRSERPLLPPDAIAANCARIGDQLSRFLGADEERVRIVNNVEWLRDIPLLAFLRDTGKHFTLSYMLQKESVKGRMELGISFTEFAYMLVQAYDYWHLYCSEGCELQMGGSDQWGNITAGIELVARRERAKVHGLVFPLLTTATGTKFGKSEAGNVWLDAEKTSPYRFHQFWLNCDDQDVERLLKLCTFMPLEDITAIITKHLESPGARHAQRLLAKDVTTRIHGSDTTASVIQASRILFGDTTIRDTDTAALEILAGELTVGRIADTAVAHGIGIVDALLTAGLASSKADARRGIRGGGFRVNGDKIAGDSQVLGRADLLAGRYILLQKGRKNHALLITDA